MRLICSSIVFSASAWRRAIARYSCSLPSSGASVFVAMTSASWPRRFRLRAGHRCGCRHWRASPSRAGRPASAGRWPGCRRGLLCPREARREPVAAAAGGLVGQRPGDALRHAGRVCAAARGRRLAGEQPADLRAGPTAGVAGPLRRGACEGAGDHQRQQPVQGDGRYGPAGAPRRRHRRPPRRLRLRWLRSLGSSKSPPRS